MAKAIEGFSYTEPSDAAIPQYRAVTATSTGVDLVSANDQVIVGISGNKTTAAGQAVTIVHSGIALMEASAAIAKGAKVGMTTNGRAVTATSTKTLVGIAKEAAGAAGDLIGVLLVSPGSIAP